MTKTKSVAATLAAVLLVSWLAALAAAQEAKLHSAISPAPVDADWWTKRHEAMNQRVRERNVDLVLIGDSITHGWEGNGKDVWNEYYAKRNAVNLGIGGDRTQNVLWRLEHGNIEGIAPKLAVLMIGTNNSGGNTPEEIADGVAKIVQKLREKLPKTKVLVLAIFPRGADPSDKLRQVNEKANKIIAKLADGKMIEYLDIGSRFLKPDGTLTTDVMPDLLHLTPASYRTWAEAIEPAVSKAMGETAAKPVGDEQGFTPLADGKTLGGWRKAGGEATYQVEGDSIVGEVGPGSNTFLCTEENYGDFILKLEAKFDVPGNSGIQLRSHQRDGDGRVFGYQCEIDPSDRAWSGGIYDESRRGWLYSLEGREDARNALKVDGWNEFVIQAIGPSIKTWINGVACADLIDTADLDGFIALQVHAGEKGKIRWRNIRLKDLGHSTWKPLFDGRSLDGWRAIGGGRWTVEDGVIHGTSAASEPRHGLLITARPFADFAVRLAYKATKGNSGLYFRSEEGGNAGVLGFQAEIDPEKDAGGLYETGGRAWVVQPTPELVKKCFKPGEWNTMSVVAVGRRVVVEVNGQKTAELLEDPGRVRGFLALQLHGGQNMDVRFKDVEVLEIPAAK